MNAISLNRLKYLFREYFATHWKRDLSVFVGLFLVKTFLRYFGIGFPDLIAIYIISIILVGISCSLGEKLRGMNYLLCPANTAEKTIVHILLTHIYFTAILVLACVLGHYATNLLFILFSTPREIALSDTGKLLDYHYFLSIFAIQSTFLFFAIYFRKHALIKTLLAYAAFVVLSILIFKYTGLSDIMVLSDKQEAESYVSYGMYNGVYAMNIMTYMKCKSNFVWLYSSNILFYITTVFFWVLSYFRLRETEV